MKKITKPNKVKFFNLMLQSLKAGLGEPEVQTCYQGNTSIACPIGKRHVEWYNVPAQGNTLKKICLREDQTTYFWLHCRFDKPQKDGSTKWNPSSFSPEKGPFDAAATILWEFESKLPDEIMEKIQAKFNDLEAKETTHIGKQLIKAPTP